MSAGRWRDRTVNIVGAAATAGAALQWIMKEEGFFEKFGLAPNIVSVADGSKLMGAVIGGSSDIVVISGFSQVLAAIEKGAKIKLVAATRFLVDDVIYSKRPEVRRLKDLEGRTFGTGSPGALLHHMTVALMRKKGIDAAKVRFVNIGSSTDVFRAVVAGTVDAGIALTTSTSTRSTTASMRSRTGSSMTSCPNTPTRRATPRIAPLPASASSWRARSRPTARCGASSRARIPRTSSCAPVPP